MFPSRFHFPAPLGSTVVSRFIATTGTLTPALLFRAPGQVSLVHRTCTSRHSVSNHPCAPVFRPCFFAPGGLGQRLAFARYRRFFGLRTLLAVSSVASGRIEFVLRAYIARQLYGLSIHFQLLSTRHRWLAVTFSSWREAPPKRDFHPPMHALSQAH